MDEGGRRIDWPAAGVTHTAQHGDDILREPERSNFANYLKDLRHDPIVALDSMTNAAYHTLTADNFSIFQDF